MINQRAFFILATLVLTSCATSYDRWQEVKGDRGLYAWATCVEREGLAAIRYAAENSRLWGPDEQPPIATGDWTLNYALQACADKDREARAALTPAQTARLRSDASRAIQRAIDAELGRQETGII